MNGHGLSRADRHGPGGGGRVGACRRRAARARRLPLNRRASAGGRGEGPRTCGREPPPPPRQPPNGGMFRWTPPPPQPRRSPSTPRPTAMPRRPLWWWCGPHARHPPPLHLRVRGEGGGGRGPQQRFCVPPNGRTDAVRFVPRLTGLGREVGAVACCPPPPPEGRTRTAVPRRRRGGVPPPSSPSNV